jgi:hypothetical protein
VVEANIASREAHLRARRAQSRDVTLDIAGAAVGIRLQQDADGDTALRRPLDRIHGTALGEEVDADVQRALGAVDLGENGLGPVLRQDEEVTTAGSTGRDGGSGLRLEQPAKWTGAPDNERRAENQAGEQEKGSAPFQTHGHHRFPVRMLVNPAGGASCGICADAGSRSPSSHEIHESGQLI